MTTRFVSVILCTYNRGEMLRECLDSILSQEYPKKEYELIVVNDGSTDNTEDILKKYEEKALCKFKWTSQKNSGLRVSRNKGIKSAKGEIICFTDDDCIADKTWIKNIVNGYESEAIGGVGGKIISHNAKNVIDKYADEKKFLTQEKFFDPILGGNISHRKDVIEKTGFLDESFMSCADVDYGIRVRLNGFKISYAPKAIIYHKHHTTLEGLIKQQRTYGRGYARMHKKYIRDYDPYYNMILIPLKIMHRVIPYPFRIIKALSVGDMKYYLSEPILDIIVSISHFIGMANETFFGKEYIGEKYKEKLEFLPEQSLNVIWKMFLSKIGM